ncbi:MAG: TonB-dependent receptor [Cyclobacteriaceae bacterium]
MRRYILCAVSSSVKLVLIGFLLYFVRPNSSFAQVTLRVQGKSDKIAVEGAVVSAQGSHIHETFSGITNDKGFIRIHGLTFPVQIQISHLSFEDQTIQITETGLTEVFLKDDLFALDQIVITGQHEPRSIDQSVYTVKAIDRKRIENQGAINLADVLSNNLNITLSPDKSSGRTSISMLGLDGQYVKILIDGIPFAGVEGNGNNADISQINMNTIERIEIVEGPMAVSYGANAMAGVINLITKKSASVNLSIQEESVGNEYGLHRGRHIQTFNAGHYLTDNLLGQIDFQRNDFRGYQGVFEGESHLLADNKRGYDWHPKTQHSVGLSLAYSQDKIQASYRFGYFHQKLDRYSSQVFLDEHPATGLTNPFALDDDNVTERLLHQLNISGQLGGISYSILSAYTGVNLERRTFRRRLTTDLIEEVLTENSSLLYSFTSRGNFTDFIDSEKVSFAAGYEYTGESVKDQDIDGGMRGIDNIALFSSMEWAVNDHFEIRPGVRTMYNSRFDAPLIYSVNTKYTAPADIEVRGSFGRSYRTPNLTELYYFFVDANHDVRGNVNLVPEDGYGASLDLKRRTKLGKGWYTGSLKVFYNDISDQITLGVVNEAPLSFQYINIDRFKSQGFTFSNQFAFSQITVNAGVSYIGRYNRLSENDNQLTTFLYAPEYNLNITHQLKKLNLTTALFYKRTGRVEQYIFNAEADDFVKGTTDAFNWLDLTTTWEAGEKLQLAGGIRNIFNISDVQTSSGVAGAHSESPTSVGLTYGRSYFLRVGYTIR